MKPHLPVSHPRLTCNAQVRDNPSLRTRQNINPSKRSPINFQASPKRSGSPYKDNMMLATQGSQGAKGYSDSTFVSSLRTSGVRSQNRRYSNQRGFRFGQPEGSIYNSSLALGRTFDISNRRATEPLGLKQQTPEQSHLVSQIQPIKQSIPRKFISDHSPNRRTAAPVRSNGLKLKDNPSNRIAESLHELNTSNKSNRSSVKVPRLDLSDITKRENIPYEMNKPAEKPRPKLQPKSQPKPQPLKVLLNIDEDEQDSRLHKFTFQGSIATDKSSFTSSSEVDGIVTSRFQISNGDENMKLGSFCETNLVVAQENARIDVRGSRDKIFITKLRHI